MEINITNLETKMCSNTFNEESIKAQLERGFGKFDAKGLLQVEFREQKVGGYEVSLKLDANKKSYTASSTDSTASKAFSQAKAKLSSQVEKQRSVQKCGKRSPKGEVKKLLKED